MAILPDITAIDIGSASMEMDNVLPALKDYFDPDVTQTEVQGGGSVIDSIRQDNRGSTGASVGPAQSPNFSLVKNSNSPTAFTIQPKDSTENWQYNLRKNSNTDALGGFDPQGKVTDPANPGSEGIQDASVGPSSTSSTGTPEESPEETALKFLNYGGPINLSSSFYVVEFDDAMYVLFINGPEDDLRGGGHFGKCFSPIFPSTTSGLSSFLNSDVPEIRLWFAGNYGLKYSLCQLGFDQWLVEEITQDGDVLERGWKSGANMAQALDLVEVNTPDGGTRPLGVMKYILGMKDSGETPGIVLDGGSKTDLVFATERQSPTTRQVIPWDANITPIFQ